MSPSSAIRTSHLNVVRGRRLVLRDLSLEIPQGRITALLGPSGCGKTTFLRCVVGAQIVNSGEVLVLGQTAGRALLRNQVGYATQNPAIYADLTIRENLRYFCRVVGAPAGDVERVLEDTVLTNYSGQMVSSLSGGERSRASLAVALLGKPKLLVLDEPTAELDPLLRDRLWNLFRGLASQGVTILVSSHVMDEAKRCDWLLLMREGQIIAADTPDNVRDQTGATDLEEAFLRLVKQMDAP